MKWITNVMKDKEEEYTKIITEFSSDGLKELNPNLAGFKNMADYKKWRNRFVEGLPQATELYSVEELVKMGLVGLYEPDNKEE
jgi:hypothetical protein